MSAEDGKLSVRASIPRTVIVLSLLYYAVSGLLLSFGTACTWNRLGPGDAPEPDYPVAGVVMLAAGVVVFVFFSRLVKKLTGREVLSR